MYLSNVADNFVVLPIARVAVATTMDGVIMIVAFGGLMKILTVGGAMN